jgi:hypothetical protein
MIMRAVGLGTLSSWAAMAGLWEQHERYLLLVFRQQRPYTSAALQLRLAAAADRDFQVPGALAENRDVLTA